MRAGLLNKQCRFERETLTPDGYGGKVRGWEAVATVWGGLSMERGRDVLEAGGMHGAAKGVLTVRYAAELAALGPNDSVVIDGVRYGLDVPINPDQRNRGLEFVVERGRAI